MKQPIFRDDRPAAEPALPTGAVGSKLAKTLPAVIPAAPADRVGGPPARYYRALDVRYWLIALAAGAGLWDVAFHFLY